MDYLPLITAIFVGASAGYLGSFMVLRQMALVGDALSHVALPGVALGLVFNFNPILGAFGALFGGILIVWFLEYRTKISTEALIGLIFTVSLSVGLLITPDEELLEALFGDISAITLIDGILAILLSVSVILIMRGLANKFILSTISDELARAEKIKTAKLNFVYLVLVAVIVALGIKTVGTLLMGALVIIPAIASRNISKGLLSYIKNSAAIGALSGGLGIFLANSYSLAPGPVVVLVSASIFLVTLFFKKS
ncbi:MAG: ABC transporter [Candidatus Yanofskybacteria bacterium CG10_big_fil_rev_8_21_14_0_10_36_16]|uniref:ABC transporter n=1 Tax=Candidatus Yanofskybacteria bacterium CG10_big_fil_rev_8_21_14_0_10_36_16 TaxID=1975096 RepID=A0A2J0Q7A1_9BACT|nr:MAG: ABC transporter [Candidatus Yanofskybacteria bacterium CG10_big_fil_rev_8_21_14_0_10_36_16]